MVSALDSAQGHVQILRTCWLFLWALSLLLTYISSYLPLFDLSPDAASTPKLSWTPAVVQPFLRWDTFHFLNIARHGYVYEYEWAFLPGAPSVMQAVSRVSRLFWPISSDEDQLVAPDKLLFSILSAAISCNSVTTLYWLSLEHTRSANFAFLASLLSLFPSSPVTLRLAPYTEPFFTFLSYKGMLYCAHSEWLFAAGCFAAAAVFRSNGFMLAGFIIWGMLVDPFLKTRKVAITALLYSVFITAVILTPFVWHQYSAYLAFCTVVTPEPWCSSMPPSIYSYVQRKYWNAGFLQYWTFQQLPNFIVAAPPLALLLIYSAHYLRHGLLPRLRGSLASYPSYNKNQSKASFVSPFLAPSLAPHAIHALVFTLTLLFAAHTQIILRLAASMPFTYWAAAWLLVEHRRWGNYWVGWSIVWGAVSIVLWTTFLPPA